MIGSNRLRTQEQRSENRTWQTTIAAKAVRLGGPPTLSLSRWKTHRRLPKHSNRLSSRTTSLELSWSGIWCIGVIAVVAHASCHRC
jgi:hypothetical protein